MGGTMSNSIDSRATIYDAARLRLEAYEGLMQLRKPINDDDLKFLKVLIMMKCRVFQTRSVIN